MRFLTYPIEGHWVADVDAGRDRRAIEMLRQPGASRACDEQLAVRGRRGLQAPQSCRRGAADGGARRGQPGLAVGRRAFRCRSCGYAVRVGGRQSGVCTERPIWPTSRCGPADEWTTRSNSRSARHRLRGLFAHHLSGLPRRARSVRCGVAASLGLCLHLLGKQSAHRRSGGLDGTEDPVFGARGRLPEPAARARYKPPPRLVAESTPGSAWILSAVQGLIDTSDPDHMRRSRALQDVMAEQVGVTDVYYRRPADHASADWTILGRAAEPSRWSADREPCPRVRV